MEVVSVFRLTPDASNEGNPFQFADADVFACAGKIYVPFVNWMKKDKPDDQDILRSEGYVNLNRPQMKRLAVTSDDRVEVEGQRFQITEVLPIAGGVYYRITFQDIHQTVQGIDYVE